MNDARGGPVGDFLRETRVNTTLMPDGRSRRLSTDPCLTAVSAAVEAVNIGRIVNHAIGALPSVEIDPSDWQEL